MKEIDDKYAKWLEETKRVQPILERPDELTRDILTKISQISEEGSKPQRLWKLASWLSTAAAGLLLCFFLHQTLFLSSLIAGNEPQYSAMESSVGVKNDVLGNLDNWKGMSILEKKRCLAELWKKRQDTQISRKALIDEYGQITSKMN